MPRRTLLLCLLAVFVPLLLGLLIPPCSAADDPPAEQPAFLVKPYLQLPAPDGMTVMWETNQKLPGRVEYGLTRDLGAAVEVKAASFLHEVRLTALKPGTTYHYRARSGELASDVYSFKTAPAAGTKKWRLAVYGDSRSNPATHRKVVEQIDKAGVDLILHTGDIVLNGKKYDTWRQEFFGPLGELAHTTPWVSTIGNHEADAERYFSYVSLPGNERYFSFDFGSAHIVCLDSNAWIEKGRDSKQYQWLADDLAKKRDTTWTFVVFHHALFSAHATRPINPLRWDWAPLLIDPANRVDAVLNGHDHFYARTYRLGRLADTPQPGVLFLTTAGGGAGLYRTRQRDYLAKEKMAHHAVFFDADDDKITVTAVDITGKEIDRFELTKQATPAEAFVAYDVEEFRRFLGLALAAAKPVRVPEREPGKIDATLEVPTRFAVPVAGQLQWQPGAGWKMKQSTVDFKLAPGEPLVIPLQVECVPAGPFPRNPKLAIAFEEGRFRNRTVEVAPFQLGGPEKVMAGATANPIEVDGKLDDKAWEKAEAHALLGLPPEGGRGDGVRLLADRDWLYVGARLDDPAGRVTVKPPVDEQDSSAVILVEEHVRVVLTDGKATRTFAVSPEQYRYFKGEKTDEPTDVKWRSAVARGEQSWCAEFALPRKLFADWSQVRVNVVHRRDRGKESQELQLCPTYVLGSDPDLLPDFRPANTTDRFARLVVE
jgi:hypothetical protein